MHTNNLKKTITFWTALSTVIGLVIGSGVFFMPEQIFKATGGAPGLGIFAWILGGLITIAAGLTATEISALFPETGGMMVYMKNIYGEKLSYLTAWMQTVLYFPSVIAALAILFSEQSCTILNKPHLKFPLTIFIIIFIVFINILGSKTSGFIQIISTIGKLLPIAFIIICGFFKTPHTTFIFSPLIGHNLSFTATLGQVLIATLFSYIRWFICSSKSVVYIWIKEQYNRY